MSLCHRWSRIQGSCCINEASLVLGDAFQRLREFVASYTFRTEAEEIEFFKVVKPRFYHHLIYYRKVYNIELNRPVGVESQHVYLRDEIKAINRYNSKHSDFVHYYRYGMTHLDSLYYLHNPNDMAIYLESFRYERALNFSTNADLKVAKLLVNELLFSVSEKRIGGTGIRVKNDSNNSLPAVLSQSILPRSRRVGFIELNFRKLKNERENNSFGKR